MTSVIARIIFLKWSMKTLKHCENVFYSIMQAGRKEISRQ